MKPVMKNVYGVLAAVAVAALCEWATAEPTVLGAWFRADEPFPEFNRFWHEGWNLPDDEHEELHNAEVEPLGGSAHLCVRNDGTSPMTITDVLLDGLSLKEAIAFSDQRKNRKPASIYYANLPAARIDRFIASGEPVWWRVDPATIAPGATGEVTVRMRQHPAGGNITIGLVTTGKPLDVAVAVRKNHPRLASVSMGADLRTVYAYFKHHAGGGTAPRRIMIDGQDLTDSAMIRSDEHVDVVPVEIRLKSPLQPGSLYCLQGVYEDGQTATAAVRAWSDEFAYGIWGGMPGKASETAVARSYIAHITDHNINVQMPQVGSPAVQAYYKSDAGRRFCETRGLRMAIDEPGKWGVRDPYLFFIHDEPDCGDYRMEGLAWNKKVGALSQWTVQRGHELREADASRLQMLNLDMTFKPHNWYIYGQVPDVMAADPYYQARIRQTYYSHPERLGLYVKATYVYAVTRVCRSACEPKPLHIILYANRHMDNANNRQFRFPTPTEKRIEVYYALAGGAKGLSYWWYPPADRGDSSAYGLGAAVTARDPDAMALMREVGLMGAEVRSVGPLITRSCPIELPLETKGVIWCRSLLAGSDSFILLVVNEQYANDRGGTVWEPIEQGARVAVDLPGWMKNVDVFEMSSEGTQDVTSRQDGGKLDIDLGRVDVTRMIVVSTKREMRGEIQERYDRQFAAKVRRMTGGMQAEE